MHTCTSSGRLLSKPFYFYALGNKMSRKKNTDTQIATFNAHVMTVIYINLFSINFDWFHRLYWTNLLLLRYLIFWHSFASTLDG